MGVVLITVVARGGQGVTLGLAAALQSNDLASIRFVMRQNSQEKESSLFVYRWLPLALRRQRLLKPSRKRPKGHAKCLSRLASSVIEHDLVTG